MDLPSAGTLALSETKKTPENRCARMIAVLMAFFMTLLTFFSSLLHPVTKKLVDTMGNRDSNAGCTPTPLPKEEFRPPSPTAGVTDANLLPSVLKKLCELEEKVETLQAKPSEMPYEKEELLNAAVCRVDALEAELIATKKV